MSARAAGQGGILGVCVLVLLGVFSFASYQVFVSVRGGRFDFTPHYVGASAFWRGETPYTPEVTARIQVAMWGYTLPPEGIDQQRYAYPAYSALLVAPLLLLPLDVATAVWMSVQIIGIMAAILIWLALLGWRVSPLVVVGLLLLLTFGLRYPIDVYVLGQFVGIMLLLLTLGVMLIMQRRDAAAGAVLAWAISPPTIAVPLVLVLLGGLLLRGRVRPAIAFAAMCAAIGAVTLIMIGWWLPDFLDLLGAYARYAPPIWALAVLPGAPAQIAAGGLALAAGGWLAWRARRGDETALIDAIGGLFALVLLFLPQTGSYYLTLLIPPLLIALRRIAGWQSGRVWGVFAWLGAVGVSWAVFSLHDFRYQAEALLMPVLVLALLCLGIARQKRDGTEIRSLSVRG
jgi:hypothetical protein